MISKQKRTRTHTLKRKPKRAVMTGGTLNNNKFTGVEPYKIPSDHTQHKPGVEYTTIDPIKTNAIALALAAHTTPTPTIISQRRIGRHSTTPQKSEYTNPTRLSEIPSKSPELPQRGGSDPTGILKLYDELYGSESGSAPPEYKNLEFDTNPSPKSVEYVNFNTKTGTQFVGANNIAAQAKFNATQNVLKQTSQAALAKYKQNVSNKGILNAIKTKFNSNKRNENKGTKIARREIPENIINYLKKTGYVGDVIKKTKEIMGQVQSDKRFRTTILPWKQKKTLKVNNNAMKAAEQGYLPNSSSQNNKLFRLYMGSKGYELMNPSYITVAGENDVGETESSA